MKQLASIACRHATTDGRWCGAGTRAVLAAMAFTPIIAPFLLLDLRIARFRLAEFQLRRPRYEFFTPTALAGNQFEVVVSSWANQDGLEDSYRSNR